MRKTLLLIVLTGCALSVQEEQLEYDDERSLVVAGVAASSSTNDGASELVEVYRTEPRTVDSAYIEEIFAWRDEHYGPREYDETEADYVAEALSAASSLPASQVVRVTARLEGRADYAEFHAAETRHERELAVQRIQSELRREQHAFVEALKLDETDDGVSYHWLSNLIGFNMEAGRVPEVAAQPGVERLFVMDVSDSTSVEQAVGSDGLELRQDTQSLALENAGFDGSTFDSYFFGGRIGQIEALQNSDLSPNYLRFTHEAFEDASGTLRVKLITDCTPNCFPQLLQPTASQSHGTAVAWVMMGTGIQSGSSVAQRTSINTNAELNYYRVNSCEGVVSAFEHGALNDVSIWNMSMTPNQGLGCSRTADCQGLNDALFNLHDPIFKSAGNKGRVTDDEGESHCTLTYPAWRPEVTTVGALDNVPFAGEVPYNTTGPRDDSSTGGVRVRFATGYTGSRDDSVDLMGAATLTQYARGNNSSSWATLVNNGGTSFAAPQATANYMLLTEAITDEFGIFLVDDGAFHANMLLMGDGARGRSGASPEVAAGFSDLMGAGRIRMHFPSDADLVAPWHWQISQFSMVPGLSSGIIVDTTGPEPSASTQFKWAVHWNEHSLTAAADIVTEVWDTCPSGGGSSVRLAFDWSYSLKKRIVLSGSDVANRCLEARVLYLAGPTGSGLDTRIIDGAMYLHSGSTSNH